MSEIERGRCARCHTKASEPVFVCGTCGYRGCGKCVDPMTERCKRRSHGHEYNPLGSIRSPEERKPPERRISSGGKPEWLCCSCEEYFSGEEIDKYHGCCERCACKKTTPMGSGRGALDADLVKALGMDDSWGEALGVALPLTEDELAARDDEDDEEDEDYDEVWQLPDRGKIGDIYRVMPAGDVYAWLDGEWCEVVDEEDADFSIDEKGEIRFATYSNWAQAIMRFGKKSMSDFGDVPDAGAPFQSAERWGSGEAGVAAWFERSTKIVNLLASWQRVCRSNVLGAKSLATMLEKFISRLPADEIFSAVRDIIKPIAFGWYLTEFVSGHIHEGGRHRFAFRIFSQADGWMLALLGMRRVLDQRWEEVMVLINRDAGVFGQKISDGHAGRRLLDNWFRTVWHSMENGICEMNDLAVRTPAYFSQLLGVAVAVVTAIPDERLRGWDADPDCRDMRYLERAGMRMHETLIQVMKTASPIVTASVLAAIGQQAAEYRRRQGGG